MSVSLLLNANVTDEGRFTALALHNRRRIGKEKDPNYRNLLMAEYRIIKGLQDKITKNAHVVYRLRMGY